MKTLLTLFLFVAHLAIVPRSSWASNFCTSQESIHQTSKSILAACQTDLSLGCKKINSCGRTNNTNKLDLNRLPKISVNCEQTMICPEGQSLVCASAYATAFCMDIDLKKDLAGTPDGNHSYNSCKKYCADKGYRLPTNNEWLIAAEGTDENNCLPTNPITKPDSNSRKAMSDPIVNSRALSYARPACKSKYQIRDMAGVLGQWVEDNPKSNPKFGRFNGGLWPQKASTIFYTTTAHHKSYSDYSIGCRCASEAKPSKR